MSMQRVIQKACKQKCMYWAPSQHNGEEHVFPQPVETKCRWENVGEVLDLASGDSYQSNATVLINGIIIEEGGYLWLGSSEELLAAHGKITNPKQISTAYMIRKREIIPFIGATSIEVGKCAVYAYL